MDNSQAAIGILIGILIGFSAGLTTFVIINKSPGDFSCSAYNAAPTPRIIKGI